MEIYLVGGAVRDALLGLPVHDRDYVVVGSSPGEMLALGFRSVGKDFPVFLHPNTQEAYALARTERKTAKGYQGFSFHAVPDVTIEQDLGRRDFTINSIAVKPHGSWTNEQFSAENSKHWIVVDPHGGQADLQAGVLRHVTDAFREDPVRILRLARFSARFASFKVATQTMALMQAMVQSGEADALVAERVWQELSRGLMEAKPSRMLTQLLACGAWERLLPEWTLGAQSGALLDACADEQAGLGVRFAALVSSLRPCAPSGWVDGGCETSGEGEGEGQVATASQPDWRVAARRLRVPSECQSLACLVLQEEDAFAATAACSAGELVAFLERSDAWRRPDRLANAVQAWRLLGAHRWGAADWNAASLAVADGGDPNPNPNPNPKHSHSHSHSHSESESERERRLALALEACKRVDAQAVAAKAQADAVQAPPAHALAYAKENPK